MYILRSLCTIHVDTKMILSYMLSSKRLIYELYKSYFLKPIFIQLCLEFIEQYSLKCFNIVIAINAFDVYY
jgi:hypothetical protein